MHRKAAAAHSKSMVSNEWNRYARRSLGNCFASCYVTVDTIRIIPAERPRERAEQLRWSYIIMYT